MYRSTPGRARVGLKPGGRPKSVLLPGVAPSRSPSTRHPKPCDAVQDLNLTERTGSHRQTITRLKLPPLRYLDSWLLVHAAARLSEGIPAERALLTGILQRAYRTTGIDWQKRKS